MVQSDYFAISSGKISQYDDVIRKYSTEIGWDWRLVASLVYQESRFNIQVLSKPRDDAAGEAFDKAAAVLGLSYPGGPAIDRAAREGDPQAVEFPRTMLEPDSFDFSFSGIKTAVLYRCYGPNARGRNGEPPPPEAVPDLAASFQEAVVDVLTEKLIRAAKERSVRRVVVGGGVAANGRLREKLTRRAGAEGLEVYFPPTALCTDNAVMVAGLAYHHLKAGRTSPLDVDTQAQVERL